MPNDLRISCKRLARPALTYVPPPAIGGWRRTSIPLGRACRLHTRVRSQPAHRHSERVQCSGALTHRTILQEPSDWHRHSSEPRISRFTPTEAPGK